MDVTDKHYNLRIQHSKTAFLALLWVYDWSTYSEGSSNNLGLFSELSKNKTQKSSYFQLFPDHKIQKQVYY